MVYLSVAHFQGCKKKIAVFGLARSGLAVSLLLYSEGYEVVVWDDNPDNRTKLSSDYPELRFSNLYYDNAWDDVGVLLVSPGISHLYSDQHPIIQSAIKAGVVIDNDIGLFFNRNRNIYKYRTIAVTGSNGKSTTTSLISFLLSSIGINAKAGGNIGTAISSLVPDTIPAKENSCVVLELSSYQLELASDLSPEIAVFTNLSSDHLDRHNGIGGYFAAKRRLFDCAVSSTCLRTAIIGVNEVEGKFLANNMLSKGIDVICISDSKPSSVSKWCIYADKEGVIHEVKEGIDIYSFDSNNIPTLKGSHNLQNVCTAYAACRAYGIEALLISKHVADFPGIAHRLELLGVKNRIHVINDSKATNIDSVSKALHSWSRIHLIMGGQNKDGSQPSSLNYLMDRVKALYFIGESSEYFYDSINHDTKIMCITMENAWKQIIERVDQGDTIMLSPGCASFDQYKSFEDRGDSFRKIAMEWLNAD